MQNVILEDNPQTEISVFIVWLKMYDVDSLEIAQKASQLIGDDPRVTQFYDPEQISGLEVASGLGAGSGEVAWDIYLIFDGQAKWVDRLPQPLDWVHQLRGSGWADQERLSTGDQLVGKLREMAVKLLRDELDS